MSEPRMRFWGWGEPRHPPRISDAARAMMRHELGLGEVHRPPVSLEEVSLSESRLSPDLARRLRAHTDREARVRHAAGKSYPDLVRMRAGDASGAPDGVLEPASPEEVADALAICGEEGVAVVPYGGGTSVVGGVEPLRGRFDAVVSLDLGRLDSLTVDRVSLTATMGAGLRAPRAEARLNGRGLTLGHFPQSFEFATIGGYVATRSAGQASTGYGRIDRLVIGLRCTTPSGEIVVEPMPASAAGPALRELVVGSEGTLGVITEATLAVRTLPERRRYEGWAFRSFDEGIEAFREMEQRRAAPDVARLSDEDETRMALAMSASGSLGNRLGRAYLRARGREHGCIAIMGWEGEAGEVESRSGRSRAILAGAGGLRLGRKPGESWLRARYDGPYQRDVLLEMGLAAETLETATTWSRLRGLHAAVRGALSSALAERGTPALVACHISHLYPAGASLYFTWIARAEEGAELDQWRAAKTAASDAIVASGGTITHHHAIGRDHTPWMRSEVGELGLDVLRAAKERVDPAGIMNPGKLLPDRG